MSALAKALTGVSGILVTPFDTAGEIAPDLQKPLVDRAIAAGVHVLTANGNTGEFYGLTLDEACAMVAASGTHIAGRVPLVAGVGRGVRDAQTLAEASRAAGATALMIHQPPDPFVAPRGVIAYVQAVREAGQGLPLILYLRNDAIGTDAIAALCRVEGVVGVKWATPNPMRLKAAMAAAPDHITWTGGLAEVWAPTLYAVGARGFTSGLINVWPERSVAINTALEAGDYARARALIADMQVFEDIRAEEQGGANVPGVKAALALMGEDCGVARPPAAWPLTDDQMMRLRGFMAGNGLLA
ncbi:putative 5-dehydro-4-deoxyglucarate dehydratase [Antarctobacter heliothermus]|uniref:Putative 5-dehydro-4-deoxyglucarate dehydratase n=1 Tax=Antarctobacter heliothermus TaxID=74033 RepID=A0A222EA65_9RHOB|nr:dihydrodipicolinate synthase family protein [Antarctobacter heliothermus]ASP21141.1 putative 5-dehydro-4-deoxyglucarate dehydratase [Antarctobacter heliothermus]ASP23093.1 putative 5-dehydro-4-deoxyglucarate dehydratase [Antarctobacter heliothermus]